MPKTLHLARGLHLPIDAVTQTMAFLARKRAGKTYGAMKLCEEMLGVGAQAIAIDPVGVWWGLRLDAGGKKKGIDVIVIGGLRGDLPLEAGSGVLIADLVVDQNLSAILDVSQLEDEELAQFVGTFCGRLFQRRKADPAAMHIFFEEAQLLAPERLTHKRQNKMLQAINKIVRLGGNYGMGATLISQRPQSVSKEVLTQVECLFVLQTNAAQERKAIMAWVTHHGVDVREMINDLPSLQRGEAYVWSPQWLDIFKKVKIAKRWTFDASATPKVGDHKKKPGKLSAFDIKRVSKAMAEVVERVQQNDPDQLKARIRDLESKAVRPRELAVDVDALDRAHANGYRQAEEKLGVEIKALRTRLDGAIKFIGDTADHFSTHLKKQAAKLAHTQPSPWPSRTPQAKASSTPAPPVRRGNGSTPPSSGLEPRHQRIINSLAWLEDLGAGPVDRKRLAFLAGASPKSSTFTNSLGALRSSGDVEYPGRGTVALTEQGRASVTERTGPTTSAALQEQVFAKLEPRHAKILRALVEIYPGNTSRFELSKMAGASSSSSSFTNSLGFLRGIGLLDYPRTGCVAASSNLFIEVSA